MPPKPVTDTVPFGPALINPEPTTSTPRLALLDPDPPPLPVTTTLPPLEVTRELEVTKTPAFPVFGTLLGPGPPLPRMSTAVAVVPPVTSVPAVRLTPWFEPP